MLRFRRPDPEMGCVGGDQFRPNRIAALCEVSHATLSLRNALPAVHGSDFAFHPRKNGFGFIVPGPGDRYFGTSYLNFCNRPKFTERSRPTAIDNTFTGALAHAFAQCRIDNQF